MASQDLQSHDLHDVAVIGAGLAGLALALSLAETGVDVMVLDRGDGTPSADPIRTTTINATSYAQLARIGMIDRMAAANSPITPVHQINVTDHQSRSEIGAKFAPTLNVSDQLIRWQDGDAPLAWVFRNHDLEAVLHQACLDHPQITMKAKVTVTDYTPKHPQLGNIAAAIYAEDQAIYCARLIVAADGAASPIRVAAGLRSITRTPGQTAIVADIRTSKPHQHTAWQRFIPGGPVALMPLDDPHVMALVWTLKDADAATLLAADEGEFNHALMAAVGDDFGRLELAGQRLHWSLKLNHAIKPYAERLVLAGDAAHAIHPLAGQGYNLAIGDAIAITSAVRSAQKTGADIGARSVMMRYARTRFVETAAMTAATDGLNALFSFGNKSAIAAAGVAMTLFNATPLKQVAQKWAQGRSGK